MAKIDIRNIDIKLSLQDNREVYSGEYVRWGSRNSFPSFLYELYQESPKHGAIINNKHLYIAGQSNDKTVLNNYGDTVSDLWSQFIKEYLIYGCSVIWFRKMNGNVVAARVLPMVSCRFDDKLSKVFYGKFIKKYSKFNYSKDENIRSIYQISNYLSASDGEYCTVFGDWYGDDIYTVPTYNSALRYIYLDYQISNFWQRYMSNGLSSGYLVNISAANATDKEKEHYQDRFNELFSGDENAGKIIFSFIHDKDKATTIQSIDSADFVTKYQQLNKTCQEEIFVAHNITSPMLFGVRTEGQLGGRNELELAYKIYYNTQIKTIRNKLLNWFRTIFPSFEVGDVTPIDPETQPALMVKGEKDEDEIKDKIFEKISSVESQVFEKVLKTVPANGFTASDENKLLNSVADVKMFEGGVGFLLTKYDVMLLKILNNAPNLGVGILSQALMLSVEETNELIQKMIRKGFIVEVKENDKVLYHLTNKAKKYLSDEKITYTDVRYSYGWKEGFSDKDKKTSRDFCIRMMKESSRREKERKLWSRGDIEKISIEMGWDVWKMRGGWYRIPGTEISVPNCRHEWKQHIVIVSSVI